ncbi:MAG TPA: hypothetical protein VNO52_02730 [Methylomirabilota bacterium]|nr:hypothetical protein [Methylomirabilota bacterium]
MLLTGCIVGKAAGLRVAVRRVVLPASLAVAVVAASAAPGTPPARWWKGNLHTHTLWSDGDDFPEMVTEWYKTNGYHFLAISDHNTLLQGEKWITIDARPDRQWAFQRYLQRLGPHWVEQRFLNHTQQVRLKRLSEFRRLYEEPDRFLLIPSQEITDRHQLLPIHVNASNSRETIKPQSGASVVDVMQRNVDAVLAQRRRTGQPMFPHINHPNFGYAITAEDLMMVRGERFFEVYNGHHQVNNAGDAHHVSIDRMWDIVLAFRLTRFKLGPMYGLATDDSHNYRVFSPTNSNSGRGWVMVRAPRLTPESIIQALEAGDFYASTGVRLKDLRRDTNEIVLVIDAEPGVRYVTQFLGTLEGFDPTSQPGSRPPGTVHPVTRRYSADIGRVLAQVEGPVASYKLVGDEIYVRATVLSSKRKANGVMPNEHETAWVQPVVRRGE